jgi:hypothetical protein
MTGLGHWDWIIPVNEFTVYYEKRVKTRCRAAEPV